MLSLLSGAMSRLSVSRGPTSSLSSSTSHQLLPSTSSRIASASPRIISHHPAVSQARYASQLAPRRTKYRKAHKGRLPIPTGGSIKGTVLSEGAFGLRLLAPARLSAKQLTSAETALKRKLKVVKGAQIFMRVFPDIPVCVKGNETRMGKGKGSFEFWACRASIGKVVFEIGGPVEIRAEIAKDALRLAAAKLPVPTEFITRQSAPRLGSIVEGSSPAAKATAAELAAEAEEDLEIGAQEAEKVVAEGAGAASAA